MAELLGPSFAPYTVAALLILIFLLVELAALLTGIAVFDIIDDALPDVEADADVDGAGAGGVLGDALSILGFGKAPFLVVLVIFLAGFSITGFAVQSVIDTVPPLEAVQGLLGGLGWILTAPLAVAGAVTASNRLSAVLGRLIPEASESTSKVDLVDRTGLVTGLGCTSESSTEAKVRGPRGAFHYPRITAEPGAEIRQGDRVRLIERRENGTFIARKSTQEKD